jgi:hypothetical protein
MREIEATVRDGRVVTETPLNLPDGTKVKIIDLEGTSGDGVDIWENSPEGLKAWHAWFDSLEPVVFTPEEESELAKFREERRAWELAHFDERIDKLKKMWE